MSRPKGSHLAEGHKKRIGKAHKGRKHKPHVGFQKGNQAGFIDGRSKDKKYIQWLKHRNRRLKKAAEGSHTYGEWELLKKQYGYTCPHCGKKEPEITLTEDHIIPLSKGGSDYIENIQPLCKRGNSEKYTKTINYKKQ